MKFKKWVYILGIILFHVTWVHAQHRTQIKMEIDTTSHVLKIEQTIVYKNTSNTILNEVVLLDWNNSYSSKKSPLAERFSEEYDAKFHFAKSSDRGYSQIESIVDKQENQLQFKYHENHLDNLVVKLNKPLHTNEEVLLIASYKVYLPNSKFQ